MPSARRQATCLGALALWAAVAVAGCGYVVIPEQAPTLAPAVAGGGWAALATNVEEADSGLRVDLAIRNDTGDWSAMALDEARPLTIRDGDGSTRSCETAAVGTGGTSIPPGFVTRGYTGGTKAAPEIELLHLECEDGRPGPGSTITIPYSYTTGEFNYYRPAPARSGTTVVDLDAAPTAVNYPVAAESDLVIVAEGEPIEAINGVLLVLAGVERTEDAIELTWTTENPTNYPAYVHIGIPPVLGSDGIIHGRYESPHLAEAPITLANGTAQWSTGVAVPADVQGLYVLPAVEAKQQKHFVFSAIQLAEG